MTHGEEHGLREIFTRCHETAVEKGWWAGEELADPNCVAAKIALMHSELSEALEEVRKGTQCYQPYFNRERPDKPEGMIVELADTVIRIADLCGALNLDLAEAISMKMEYNDQREYRHGGKKI